MKWQQWRRVAAVEEVVDLVGAIVVAKGIEAMTAMGPP